ncbi:hypothetical protein EDB89DRAFT_1925512, partial [Lactarius sanguifluus]
PPLLLFYPVSCILHFLIPGHLLFLFAFSERVCQQHDRSQARNTDTPSSTSHVFDNHASASTGRGLQPPPSPIHLPDRTAVDYDSPLLRPRQLRNVHAVGVRRQNEYYAPLVDCRSDHSQY